MKLFLIDGHALVFKMYYAFLGRPMVNSKGVDTSILFGFTKYLLELIEREKPSHLAVSFDPPGGTFRNKMYPEYKANRTETPQLVIDALQPLTDIVTAMRIPVLMIPGFEADDVIGSAAKRFVREGFEVYMVTPDKDYGQLVQPGIFQYRPGKAGENEVLGPADICSKWGIDSTAQVIDILTICGDTADNVPGVAGVGPVGASKLLQKYGSVDGIYAHLSDLTAAQKAKFDAARDHISLSRDLVTIKTDIALDVTAEDLVLAGCNNPDIEAILRQYEMPSMLRLLARLFPATADAVAEAAVPFENHGHPRACKREGPAPKAWEGWSEAEVFKGEQPRSEVQSAVANLTAISLAGDRLYIYKDGEFGSGAVEEFRAILENPAIPKAGADLKATMNELSARGINLKGRLLDVSLMHYILDPESNHSLPELARTILGVDLESGPAETGSLFDEQPEDAGPDREQETKAIASLAGTLSRGLDATEGMRRLYDDIEEPLIGVLSRMECVGVRIEPRALKEYADSLRESMLASEAKVREIAGNPALNVASPKQIGELIFERLKLDPGAKKPRSGNWPTDEQTLSELSDRSPVIGAILDYRLTRKLLGTYIEPIPGYIRQDGRVHTTFNQALTSTGRLSSSNPNLQNIPIRTEQGREIRKAFVPSDPGSVIMSADYSQIELRIMAHLCGDTHLQESFRSGVDVHAATASKIFAVPIDKVSADQRRVAKTANFGIMYGISAFGLSQRLGCGRGEAKQIIDDYFASFPSIRAWIDATLASARENGYVETIFGRRRYVPDVVSSNGNLRALAERNAVNAPIQGSSADIIKLAMIGVDRRLREEGLRSRMVLQIHDELLLEVPSDEIEKVRDILTSEMEGVMRLDVPLTVECNYGSNWLEAH